jgi:two-component system phosphate regulon sensor histidine kinase PhoR
MAADPIHLRRHAVWMILAICLFTFAGGLSISGARLASDLEDRVAAELKGNALLSVKLLADKSPEEIEASCRALAKDVDARVTWLTPEGRVLADSETEPGALLPLSRNAELRSAAFGTAGQVFEAGATSGVRRVIIAVPAIDDDGSVIAIVRLSRALPVRAVMLKTYSGFAVTAIMAAVFLVLATSSLIGRITSFSGGLRDAIEAEPVGQVQRSNIAEMDQLSVAVAGLADRLTQSTAEAARQKAETDVLFASMREGILVIDDRDMLLLINDAAAGFLAIGDRAAVLNRPYLESIRNVDLRERVRRTRLQSAQIAPENVVLDDSGQEQRILRISATRVDYGEGRPFAVLMVMSDVTRTHRLERMRAQFAGNVSHELKTPLTAIKGYAELLDDAIDDDSGVKSYAATIDRHVDRMIAIVNDLLYLSRIEHSDSELVEDFEECKIDELLRQCAAVHIGPAEARSIKVNIDAPATLVHVNRRLLDRAISNLLSNAIRYSDCGSVELSATIEDSVIRLSVSDNGPGIDPQHHERIFERFYRVDQGRDRDSGGTGLGLAIVKHIAILHGGRVDVQSSPGQGSRFIIEIPR